MNRAIHQESTAIRTASDQLATAANNVANLQTPGYRALRLAVSVNSVAEITALSGISYQPTGNPLDLATPDGYFSVSMPNGDIAYTENGTFQPDATGRLTDTSGHPLFPPVTLPSGSTAITVDHAGNVSVELDGRAQVVGKVVVTRFANPQGLQAMQGGTFRPTSESGPPQLTDSPIASGYLRTANPDLIEAEIQMSTSLVQTQAASQIFRTTEEMHNALLDIKA